MYTLQSEVKRRRDVTLKYKLPLCSGILKYRNDTSKKNFSLSYEGYGKNISLATGSTKKPALPTVHGAIIVWFVAGID